MSEGAKGGHPIIVKKKKKHDHGHHGGAWKVAYADFVTAMKALFIVLWILAQGEAMKENIANYFKDPAGFMSGGAPNVIEGNDSGGEPKSIIDDVSLKEAEKRRMEEMGNSLQSQLSSTPEFAEIMDNVVIEFIQEGMRIELMESAKDVFFEIGTSTLNQNAQKLLLAIGNNLKSLNNKIIVEGHTDSRPYSNSRMGYSNYELSADRANAARRAILTSGMDEHQITEVRGFADNRLRIPDDPFDFKNRRISILVKYSEEQTTLSGTKSDSTKSNEGK